MFAESEIKWYLVAYLTLKSRKTMKKVLQTLMIAALALPTLTFANTAQTTTVDKVQAARGATTAQAVVKDDNITVMSPRTGIRYTFANPNQRPVILKTTAVTAANAANVNRIVASNPALSTASQEKAKQALLSESAQLASN
ncbi:hypothetical protein SAMN05421643_12043 [Acinetobacter kyonggiensis]|uniref:Uncharacterized protein n=2 Tax=Moraxellaceae TaxID=468 RepID=A0A1H3LTZ2_9GAMM|nr:hypothetical protein SAMN05421643_12043 [Acinetobacter kyonggiensis]